MSASPDPLRARLARKDLLDFCVNPQYVYALERPDGLLAAERGPA